jgi:hypothetical protein
MVGIRTATGRVEEENAHAHSNKGLSGSRQIGDVCHNPSRQTAGDVTRDTDKNFRTVPLAVALTLICTAVFGHGSEE